MASKSKKNAPANELDQLIEQLRATNVAMQKIIERNRAESLEKYYCCDLESLRAPDILKTNNTPGKKE